MHPFQIKGLYGNLLLKAIDLPGGGIVHTIKSAHNFRTLYNHVGFLVQIQDKKQTSSNIAVCQYLSYFPLDYNLLVGGGGHVCVITAISSVLGTGPRHKRQSMSICHG